MIYNVNTQNITLGLMHHVVLVQIVSQKSTCYQKGGKLSNK